MDWRSHCEARKAHLSGTTAAEFISRFTRSGGAQENFVFLVHKRDVVRNTGKSRRTRTSALWKGVSEGWTDASLGRYHMEPTCLTHSSGHRLVVGVMALTRGSVRLLELPWFSWPIK